MDGFCRNYIRPPGKIKVHSRRLEANFLARAGLVSLLCAALGACAASPRLQPIASPTEPSVTVAEAGIQLTISPNAWASYPTNLPRYYTPLQVRISNTRGEAIQVRYEDFIVLDDAKNQYRAVPPFEVSRALFGGQDIYGPWAPYWSRPWGWRGGWGPGWGWYPYDYAWPQDVLLLALRSGPLLPGASLEGFLYFQQATARGNSIDLSWTPQLADKSTATRLSAQFQIVRP